MFWCYEAAHWYPARRHEDGFFNWTMTYRRDSDIQITYGDLRKTK